ncbi:hypothetical protein QBC40DRAFT_42762 [Triangularia verruculosa]|uniref:Uncharacterized protein n=1 Tax=Triangularia verruculosa TaxID=2587418 RepID=A0AAN6XLE5_9PEZI|nr:hypothetical protein QBC40DRAFT_42762 [Triangularia verruculosa]
MGWFPRGWVWCLYQLAAATGIFWRFFCWKLGQRLFKMFQLAPSQSLWPPFILLMPSMRHGPRAVSAQPVSPTIFISVRSNPSAKFICKPDTITPRRQLAGGVRELLNPSSRTTNGTA